MRFDSSHCAASSDYQSVATLLLFDSSISHVCVNISVEDDQLAEGEEHFSVAISTNESRSRLRIEVQEAVVTILDDDGRYTSLYVSMSKWLNCNLREVFCSYPCVFHSLRLCIPY